MKNINLEEILISKIGKSATETAKIAYRRNGDPNSLYENIMIAIKEAIRQSLELASENATAYYFTDKYSNGKPTNAVDAIVDKDSILDTLNQIE